MNFTVHLTENCNMACSYCLREKTPKDMSVETLYKTIDLAYSKGTVAGFCFFGGEPLLKKDLIYVTGLLITVRKRLRRPEFPVRSR